MSDNLTLGERIEQQLLAIDMNPSELSRLSGISQSTLSRIIGDDRSVKANVLFTIASILQLDPVYLFTGLTTDNWLLEQEKLCTPVGPLGLRINARLKELDMSLGELARHSGLSKSILAAIIHGGNDTDPRMSVLISIAHALQTDLNWLCTGHTYDD